MSVILLTKRRGLGFLLMAWLLGSCGDPDTGRDEPPQDGKSRQIVATDPAELEDLPELQEAVRESTPGKDSGPADVPPTSSIPDSPAEPPLLPDYREQVWSQIDSSLLGNPEHAVNTALVMHRCSGKTLDPDRISRQLAHLQSLEVKPGTRWNFSSGMSLVYESYDQYAALLWQMHDQCQSVNGLFGPELRSRIKDLADRGNPEARYLYAMWPPVKSLAAPESALETLDYYNRALQYTWSNLEEREWLGVMAMGQSYSGSSAASFTPVNASLGRVFLMAAELCGIENDWLRDHNTELRTRLQRQTRQATLTGFEKDATEIAALFCE